MNELEESLTVYIVDDDSSVRDSLALLLCARGFKTRVFDSADSFLAAAANRSTEWAGCLLTDIRMPGISGLELLSRAPEFDLALPIVIMSAHGDVPSVRLAFLHSAVDFLAKPFAEEDLISAIEQSFDRERTRLSTRGVQDLVRMRTGALTGREREICDLMIAGMSNHEIAARLGISHRTVQVHRGHVMQKMQVATLAELISVCRESDAART